MSGISRKRMSYKWSAATGLALWLLGICGACAADLESRPGAAQAAFADGDYERALTLWREGAQAGNAQAQYELGRLHGRGLGTEQSYSKAVFWYLKAAKQGYADAQHLLCLSYATGRGVSKDRVKAYAWCTLAIDSGAEAAGETRELISQEMSEEELPLAEEVTAIMQKRMRIESP